jgi:hypothetical protein
MIPQLGNPGNCGSGFYKTVLETEFLSWKIV